MAGVNGQCIGLFLMLSLTTERHCKDLGASSPPEFHQRQHIFPFPLPGKELVGSNLMPRFAARNLNTGKKNSTIKPQGKIIKSHEKIIKSEKINSQNSSIKISYQNISGTKRNENDMLKQEVTGNKTHVHNQYLKKLKAIKEYYTSILRGKLKLKPSMENVTEDKTYLIQLLNKVLKNQDNKNITFENLLKNTMEKNNITDRNVTGPNRVVNSFLANDSHKVFDKVHNYDKTPSTIFNTVKNINNTFYDNFGNSTAKTNSLDNDNSSLLRIIEKAGDEEAGDEEAGDEEAGDEEASDMKPNTNISTGTVLNETIVNSSSQFVHRIGEVAGKNTLEDQLFQEPENILKLMTNEMPAAAYNHYDLEEHAVSKPLADLSFWMQPSSKKNIIFNSTLSVNPPFINMESSGNDNSVLNIIRRLTSLRKKVTNQPNATDQDTNFNELIDLISKFNEQENNLPSPLTNSFGFQLDNLNNNLLTDSTKFATLPIFNFSQEINNSIPPEVLANLLVRLRVPTASEIASVIPDTRFTPELTTAIADFITNISNAIAQFLRDLQAAIAANPIVGVILAVVILAIIWHIFEKKKKYKHHGGHGHGGGYHRRSDWTQQFRNFDDDGTYLTVNVLKHLSNYESWLQGINKNYGNSSF